MYRIDKIINYYFTPLFNNIKDVIILIYFKVGCLITIDGPIINVLRKSF